MIMLMMTIMTIIMIMMTKMMLSFPSLIFLAFINAFGVLTRFFFLVLSLEKLSTTEENIRV